MKRDFRTNHMRPFMPLPEPLGEGGKAKVEMSVKAREKAPKTPLEKRGAAGVEVCGKDRAAHAKGKERAPCVPPWELPREPPPLPAKTPKRTDAGAFCIVVDSREQTPLVFPEGVNTRRGTLHTGDYSIAGFEDAFTVERKSLADAVNTVIHDRARFIRELERMRPFAFRRILITAPFARVAAGAYKHSRANPNAVVGLLCALEIRYAVPVVFAADATEAARRVLDWARHFTREHGHADTGRLENGEHPQGRFFPPPESRLSDAQRLTTITDSAPTRRGKGGST